jgi:hypothetical protein
MVSSPDGLLPNYKLSRRACVSTPGADHAPLDPSVADSSIDSDIDPLYA